MVVGFEVFSPVCLAETVSGAKLGAMNCRKFWWWPEAATVQCAKKSACDGNWAALIRRKPDFFSGAPASRSVPLKID